MPGNALDLTSQSFKANPYPLYAELRASSPVRRTRLPDGREAWLLTRYDNVVTALKDPRLAKDRRRITNLQRLPLESLLAPLLKPLSVNMLDLDGADHARLRGLVHKAFTPRIVEQLRERIQRLANDLLDRAERTGGRFDLVSGYALPIPATVIADLLGVPASDRERFHRWSSNLVSITSGRDVLRAVPSGLLFMRYLRRQFAARRAEPREDLISALVRTEEAGDRLTADELMSMAFLLLVAGHETTVNLIATGTLALLQQPDALQRLQSDPTLCASAVEELLRFTSPVQIATERYALEDIPLDGQTIPLNALVLAVLASANHDERQFALPEQLDLDRTPNPHLAFGQGAHYCLGAPLARLEAQIAFSTLVRRFPSLRLDEPADAVRWRRGLFLRGPLSLPVQAGGRVAVAA